MIEKSVQTAIWTLGAVAALSVICLAILIGLRQAGEAPETLAVLASVASGAVGAIAGMITPSRRDANEDGQRRPRGEEERPERQGVVSTRPPTSREEPPPGEERPGRRAP
jgi:hypothetical protein